MLATRGGAFRIHRQTGGPCQLFSLSLWDTETQVSPPSRYLTEPGKMSERKKEIMNTKDWISEEDKLNVQ